MTATTTVSTFSTCTWHAHHVSLSHSFLFVIKYARISMSTAVTLLLPHSTLVHLYLCTHTQYKHDDITKTYLEYHVKTYAPRKCLVHISKGHCLLQYLVSTGIFFFEKHGHYDNHKNMPFFFLRHLRYETVSLLLILIGNLNKRTRQISLHCIYVRPNDETSPHCPAGQCFCTVWLVIFQFKIANTHVYTKIIEVL